MANNVIIYSTPTCVYCQAAKDFFKENGVAYTEKDVGDSLKYWIELVEDFGKKIEVQKLSKKRFRKD
mgnify:CR=1 FL=1